VAVYPDIRHAIRNRIGVQLGSWPAALLEPLLSYQSRFRFGVGPGALSPIDALRRYRGPVLVIGGDRDRYTPPAETRALFEAAPGRKKILWVSGDHAAVSGVSSIGHCDKLAQFLASTIGVGRKPVDAPPTLAY